jgi:Zn-dependent protease
MQDIFQNVGRELPFILLLLALLGFRWRVTPRASVFIRAPMDKIFPLVDFSEGDNQRWQRTRVTCTRVDAPGEVYRLTFVTALATGSVQSSNALFEVVKRDAPRLIEVRRVGLEGKSDNSELLRMRTELSPERDGTRFRITYEWGPRPLLAQILGRADLWGSAYRIKGVAETGVPDYRTDALISAGLALVTGAISLWAFAFAFGWGIALLLLAALLVHEFGHLLAYRLIGQPWGRMVFLPFLGAVAVPRLGFVTQGQSVFAALMGPAFSILIPLLAVAYLWSGPSGFGRDLALSFGLVAVGLNLFNLLPVEPLDGGVVLRSVAARLLGSWARFGLIAAGLAILAAGWYAQQILLLIFGALAILMNIRTRKIDTGLEPLSRLQVVISAFAFMSVVAAYTVFMRFFLETLS